MTSTIISFAHSSILLPYEEHHHHLNTFLSEPPVTSELSLVSMEPKGETRARSIQISRVQGCYVCGDNIGTSVDNESFARSVGAFQCVGLAMNMRGRTRISLALNAKPI